MRSVWGHLSVVTVSRPSGVVRKVAFEECIGIRRRLPVGRDYSHIDHVRCGCRRFFVSGAATTTNGGATANGADSVTVTESGSITTNSNLGSGLLATASDGNTLTNNGTITTSGSVSVGLVANTGDRNTLINNGTVTTSGSQSYGLSLRGTGNTMINNGTVTTSGVNSPAFLRRLRLSVSAAVRTRRATASRSSRACASGCRTSRCNRTRLAVLPRGFCRSGA